MDEKEKVAYPGRAGDATSDPVRHKKCMKRLQHAIEKSKYQGYS